jgi:hypothetical protein
MGQTFWTSKLLFKIQVCWWIWMNIWNLWCSITWRKPLDSVTCNDTKTIHFCSHCVYICLILTLKIWGVWPIDAQQCFLFILA